MTRFALALLLAAPAAFAQAYPGHWTARFIWQEGDAHPYHQFLMARRTFSLDQAPSSARLHITAADRYVLYLNGQYLGRGPARSDARWTSYDTYDLTTRLRPGSNTLAVLAYHYGCPSAYTRDARAGLFAQLDWTTPTGATRTLGTDENWRLHQARAWRQDAPLVNQGVGVTEIYDANLDPPDWTAPTFNDSACDRAFVIPQRHAPWSYLEPRKTPLLREHELRPTRLAGSGEFVELPRLMFAETAIAERLMSEPPRPLEHAKITNPEAVLAPGPRAAEFQTSPHLPGESREKGSRAPYLIVDFGRPVFGFPRIELTGPANAVVDITYGPDLVDGRVRPLDQGVRYGDRYILRPGPQTWQLFEYKQFRYLQVVVRKAPTPVKINSIRVVSYDYPAPRLGRFECSDPTLTALWKAAVDTTYLHMEDVLVCDAVRERVPWTGDGAHGLHGIYAGFGDLAISDWYFRLIARGQLPDGLLRMTWPGPDSAVGARPRSNSIVTAENPLNIPQFALFYGLLAGEHHRNFPKPELMRDLYPTLTALAAWCHRQSDDTGLLYSLPNWNFTDWVATEMQGANLETNILYYAFLKELEDLAASLGHPDDATRWRTRAATVLASIRKLHWNPAQGVYADSVINGTQSSTVTELSNGLALLYGIATPEQTPRILARLRDPQARIERATPLYFYYVAEGLIRAGAATFALEQLRDRYRPMMNRSDFPTLWENWLNRIGPGASQVHSGGAGAAWTLSRHVLGVQPADVRSGRWRIAPETALLDWARGAVPTARGLIEVEWRKHSGQVSLDVKLPPGVTADLVLPGHPVRTVTGP